MSTTHTPIVTPAPASPPPIDEHARDLRASIQMTAEIVRSLTRHPDILEARQKRVDAEEMRENLWLAFRHLEDARMRLGKVIQHAEGRAHSIYD